MTLLVDSGNSRLHAAWWDSSEVCNAIAVEYPDNTESLAALMQSITGEREPEKIAACSVNSKWRERLFGILDSMAPEHLNVVRTAGELGIAVCYKDPRTLGIDRVLAGYAAWRRLGEPCVVIDAGTAITVDAFGVDGAMTGGYIIPGFQLMVGAMAAHTDLPNVTEDGASESPGDSTEACIRNGISVAIHTAVKRLAALAASYADTSRIIVTGGTGESLIPNLPQHAEYRPWLVLEGLGLAMDAGRIPNFKPLG